MFSIFKNQKYSYLKNRSLVSIANNFKRNLSTANNPEDLIINAFCGIAFAKSRIYEICKTREPKTIYVEPQNLPNLIESTLLDIWVAYYSFSNSFYPINRDLLSNWLSQCNANALGILGNVGWNMNDLTKLRSILPERFDNYTSLYSLSVSGNQRDSFKFAEYVIRNIFGHEDSENIGLLMSIQINTSSEVLSTIEAFRDFDLGISRK